MGNTASDQNNSKASPYQSHTVSQQQQLLSQRPKNQIFSQPNIKKQENNSQKFNQQSNEFQPQIHHAAAVQPQKLQNQMKESINILNNNAILANNGNKQPDEFNILNQDNRNFNYQQQYQQQQQQTQQYFDQQQQQSQISYSQDNTEPHNINQKFELSGNDQLQQQQQQQQQYQQCEQENDFENCTDNTFSHPHILTQNNANDNDRYCTLESIISDRLGTNKLFPEDDIQALFKGIASALAYLQDKNFGHGDIHTDSIYFEQNSGAFMISDARPQGYGYIQALDRKKFSYLAPELIQALRNSSTPNQTEITNVDMYRSDVFSLGLVILEAATLQSSKNCYDFSYSILAHVINERINFVSQYYSPSLTNFLKKMLDFTIQRPSCKELWELIVQQASAEDFNQFSNQDNNYLQQLTEQDEQQAQNHQQQQNYSNYQNQQQWSFQQQQQQQLIQPPNYLQQLQQFDQNQNSVPQQFSYQVQNQDQNIQQQQNQLNQQMQNQFTLNPNDTQNTGPDEQGQNQSTNQSQILEQSHQMINQSQYQTFQQQQTQNQQFHTFQQEQVNRPQQQQQQQQQLSNSQQRDEQREQVQKQTTDIQQQKQPLQDLQQSRETQQSQIIQQAQQSFKEANGNEQDGEIVLINGIPHIARVRKVTPEQQKEQQDSQNQKNTFEQSQKSQSQAQQNQHNQQKQCLDQQYQSQNNQYLSPQFSQQQTTQQEGQEKNQQQIFSNQKPIELPQMTKDSQLINLELTSAQKRQKILLDNDQQIKPQTYNFDFKQQQKQQQQLLLKKQQYSLQQQQQILVKSQPQQTQINSQNNSQSQQQQNDDNKTLQIQQQGSQIDFQELEKRGFKKVEKPHPNAVQISHENQTLQQEKENNGVKYINSAQKQVANILTESPSKINSNTKNLSPLKQYSNQKTEISEEKSSRTKEIQLLSQQKQKQLDQVIYQTQLQQQSDKKNQDQSQSDHKQTVYNSLDERIKQVIARSKAIRESIN